MATKPAACAVCEIHAESVFKIDGMDCREEVAILERRLKPLPGLEDLTADLVGTAAARPRTTPRTSRPPTIVEAVAQTGMRAWLEHETPVGHTAAATARQTLCHGSGAALAAGLIFEFMDLSRPLVRGTFLVAILTGGIYTARRAWAATRVMSLDINVLMLVAVVGAMTIGEWSEGATVTFLFAFAQILEARSMDRARHAIRALMDLTPPEARRAARRAGRARAGRRRARRGDSARQAGRENSARRRRRRGHEPRQSGADHRRVAAGRQVGGRRRLSRATINGYGALDVRVTHLRQRHDAGAHHRARRAGAVAARAQPGVRRAVRALLHAGHHRARDWRRGHSAVRARRSRSACGSIARSCCWSSRAPARWSFPRRCRWCRRSPPRREKAC